MYVGVGLASTPASLWGGAMLLLARRIAPRRAPEPRITALALEHADPGGEETGRCTALALQFLGHEAPARVSPPATWGTRLSADGAARELYLLLHPQTAAPWLREMVTAAQAAARATPLDARTASRSSGSSAGHAGETTGRRSSTWGRSTKRSVVRVAS